MKVQITEKGYIGLRRVYPGDIIEVAEKQYSKRWMKPYNGRKPAKPNPTPKEEESVLGAGSEDDDINDVEDSSEGSEAQGSSEDANVI